jgi:hypothetical protein
VIVSVGEQAHNGQAARRKVRVVEGPRLHLPLGRGTLSITASGELARSAHRRVQAKEHASQLGESGKSGDSNSGVQEGEMVGERTSGREEARVKSIGRSVRCVLLRGRSHAAGARGSGHDRCSRNTWAAGSLERV